MKLKKARVKLYRNIVDSEELTVEDRITCLVGKNESGKTAFLQALYSLNPAYPDQIDIDVTKDYPRWRMIRDSKNNNLEEVPIIEAHFILDDVNQDNFNEFMGFQIPLGELYVEKTYNDTLNAKFLAPEEEWINALLSSPLIDANIEKEISGLNTLNEILSKLEEIQEKIIEEEEDTTNAEPIEPTEEEPIEEEDEPNEELEKIENIISAIQKIHSISDESSNNEFLSFVDSCLPEFFYYSHYDALDGRIDLKSIVEKENNGEELSNGEHTALALLNLAGVKGQELLEDEYEPRIAQLEAAASEITQQVLEYWTQNEGIRVKLDIDPTNEVMPDGTHSIKRYLEVRLDDLNHFVTTNFSTRSTGFQWFFSFLVAFSKFSERDDVIILLDEPGLGLHARAQGDLLRYIEEKLGNGRQVIFTNHSPFMVNPKKLENVRLVEDLTSSENPGIGTKISEEVLSVKDDTRFPLQAALGYDIAQNLFIGGYNLIVEGPSDLLYLRLLSEHLANEDKTSLDTKITIVPVGGADKIPTFIAILGAHVDVSVLVDANMGNDQRLEDMINDNILDENRLISVGDITGNDSSNIEDLFADAEYLKLYNEAFNKNITPEDINGNGSIIKRIEKVIGHEFNHYKPSMILQKNPEYIIQLSENTLKNFNDLFNTLNKTFER